MVIQENTLRKILLKVVFFFGMLFPLLIFSTEAKKLIIENIKLGKGKEAQRFKWVTVHYTGWLKNGEKFDSSLDRQNPHTGKATPFTFQLGVGQVIKGWDSGLKGMKVGGKRKLIVPSHMAYGERGAGGVIPPNSTLIFEVELLDVQ